MREKDNGKREERVRRIHTSGTGETILANFPKKKEKGGGGVGARGQPKRYGKNQDSYFAKT